MSKVFNPLDVLRKIPTDLLKLYAHRRGVLGSFNWGAKVRADASKIVAAIKSEDREVAKRTLTELRKIWQLHGLEFTRGVLNEARHHGDSSALAALVAQRSHLAKALWVVLERPALLRNAKILRDIDKLPAGSWLRYRQLPIRPGAVSPATEQALQDALIEYFSTTQFRGENCKVDCLLRDEESIYFAYSEDHPDIELSFLDGILTPQIRVPIFQVVFKHNDSKRNLDIYVDGDRSIGPELRNLFCRAVLSEEFEDYPNSNAPLYDLERLLEAGFRWRGAEALGMAEILVTRLRLVDRGTPWRRVTAEFDTSEDPDALNELVAGMKKLLYRDRILVDQACLKIRFERTDGQAKPVRRDVWITHPNFVRLKRDELGERILVLLAQLEQETSEAPDEL